MKVDGEYKNALARELQANDTQQIEIRFPTGK
jgi:hypothetical protein